MQQSSLRLAVAIRIKTQYKLKNLNNTEDCFVLLSWNLLIFML